MKYDLNKIKHWYEIDKKSFRWIMNELRFNSARKMKKLIIESGCSIRYGSDAVKTQWINNDKRKEKASLYAKEKFAEYRCKPRTQETKNKIGLANSGERNGMWGKFGDKNPSWIGGKRNWRFKRKINKKKRVEIINKLGNKCEKCGTNNNITIHHDPPWRIVRSHDLQYLHLLCKDCHFQGPNHKR